MALAAPAEIISSRLKPNRAATSSSPGVSGRGRGRRGLSSGLKGALSGHPALRPAGKGAEPAPSGPGTSKTFGRNTGKRWEVGVGGFGGFCVRFGWDFLWALACLLSCFSCWSLWLCTKGQWKALGRDLTCFGGVCADSPAGVKNMYSVFSVSLCSLPSCGLSWSAQSRLGLPQQRSQSHAPTGRTPCRAVLSILQNSGTHSGNRVCKSTAHVGTQHAHNTPNLSVPPAASTTPLLWHHSLLPHAKPSRGTPWASNPYHTLTHKTHTAHSLPKPSLCSPVGSRMLSSHAQLFSQTAAAERARRGMEKCWGVPMACASERGMKQMPLLLVLVWVLSFTPETVKVLLYQSWYILLMESWSWVPEI